jgi:hypothetical protein
LFLQQSANALALGSVYALFAIGFTLIFGVLEIISLAQGVIFMTGAFADLLAETRLNLCIFPSLLTDELAKVRNFSGVGGRFSFNDRRDAEQKGRVLIVKNGKFALFAE